MSLKAVRNVVVYWDEVAAWNFLLDYLLLVVTLRLSGQPIHRGRVVLGALFGAAYAVATLWIPCKAWTLAPSLFIMCWIAFRRAYRRFKLTLLFCLLACALGGSVVLLGTVCGNLYPLARGVLYARVPWSVFFGAAASCYCLLTLAFRGGARHEASELVRARIAYRGRSVTLTLLRDTGNTLTDPISGVGVPVVGAQALGALFGSEATAALSDPDRAIAWAQRAGMTLLPYRAVGVTQGILPAFRCDAMSVDGAALGPRLIALSPHPISDGSGFQGLWCAQRRESEEKREIQSAME